MIVMLYHSIQNIDYENKFILSPSRFENHIKYFLKKNYKIVDIRRIYKLNPKGKYVILTFDDGFRDNYDVVFPIIKKYRVPIAVFPIINSIGKTLQLGGRRYFALSVDQIKEMYKSKLVYFGSHTYSHKPFVKNQNPGRIKKEIEKSKQAIKKLLGYDSRIFVYPKGKYDKKYRKIILKNFDFAFRRNGHAKQIKDALQIPRVEILSTHNKIDEYFRLTGMIYLINNWKEILYRTAKRMIR